MPRRKRATPPRDRYGRFISRRKNLAAYTDSRGRVRPIRGSVGYDPSALRVPEKHEYSPRPRRRGK